MKIDTQKKRLLCVTIPHASRLSHLDKKVANILFPLGLAYIIRSITSKLPQYHIDLLDLNFVSPDEQSIKQFIAETYKGGQLPEYVMFGALSTNYKQVKKVSQTLKQVLPDVKQICGGTIATIHSKYLLEKLPIDICVIGEGEETIVELLKNPDDLLSIKGIALLDKSKKYIKTITRNRPENIQSLIPVYELFNMEGYISATKYFQGYRGVLVSGSRGCMYRCKFCYRPFGNEMIYRDPDEVADEVSWLVKTYNLDYIHLCDELAWSNKEGLKKFGESLLEKKVNTMWICSCRVNQISEKDYELLKFLRKCGLVRIVFGLESASEKILNNMGKSDISQQKARVAFRFCRKARIKASASILFGFPGENRETIKETVDFIKENLLIMRNFFILQPFPGTEVYEKHVKNSISEEDWLENFSHEGDASKLVINLTDLSDDEFMNCVKQAEKEVCSRSLPHYFKYYSPKELPGHILTDIYRFIRMKIVGAYFETP